MAAVRTFLRMSTEITQLVFQGHAMAADVLPRQIQSIEIFEGGDLFCQLFEYVIELLSETLPLIMLTT